jgi:hypothetical protein
MLVFLIFPYIIMILNEPKCFGSSPLKQGIISFFCYKKPFMNETWALFGYCIFTCRFFSQSPLQGAYLFSHWLLFMIMCKTYFLLFFPSMDFISHLHMAMFNFIPTILITSQTYQASNIHTNYMRNLIFVGLYHIKSHEFHIMVNMNDICMYSIS